MRWRRTAETLTPLGSRIAPPSDSISADLSPIEVIKAWRREQTAFWRCAAPDYADVEAELLRINRESGTFYVFSFSEHGTVELLDKPGERLPEGEINAFRVRAEAYLRFFRRVLVSQGPRADGLLGMEMGDGPAWSEHVPLFAFQKPSGNKSILMIDVDSIILDFFEAEEADAKSYEDKACRAIFAGSTTGTAHTAQSVAALTDDRLRAGVFFRHHDRVDFRLPSIVQCLDDEAERLIRELGFGVGHMTWHEQLDYKFLLSLDGNGATCSRVARSLRSNSLLVKYQSPSLLYYFSGMQPWLHYIPIEDFNQVDPLVKTEQMTPNYFADVARQGRVFFENFLRREPSEIYAAGVIEDYFSIIHS